MDKGTYLFVIWAVVTQFSTRVIGSQGGVGGVGGQGGIGGHDGIGDTPFFDKRPQERAQGGTSLPVTGYPTKESTISDAVTWPINTMDDDNPNGGGGVTRVTSRGPPDNAIPDKSKDNFIVSIDDDDNDNIKEKGNATRSGNNNSDSVLTLTSKIEKWLRRTVNRLVDTQGRGQKSLYNKFMRGEQRNLKQFTNKIDDKIESKILRLGKAIKKNTNLNRNLRTKLKVLQRQNMRLLQLLKTKQIGGSRLDDERHFQKHHNAIKAMKTAMNQLADVKADDNNDDYYENPYSLQY